MYCNQLNPLGFFVSPLILLLPLLLNPHHYPTLHGVWLSPPAHVSLHKVWWSVHTMSVIQPCDHAASYPSLCQNIPSGLQQAHATINVDSNWLGSPGSYCSHVAWLLICSISPYSKERWSKTSLKPDASIPLALDRNPTFLCECTF